MAESRKTAASQFREILFIISEQLYQNDIGNLEFLLKDDLTAAQIEHASSVKFLFEVLQQKKLIEPGDPSYLVEKLIRIGRADLAERFNFQDHHKQEFENSINMFIADEFFETESFAKLKLEVVEHNSVVIKGAKGAGKTQLALHTAFQMTQHSSCYIIHCQNLQQCIDESSTLLDFLHSRISSKSACFGQKLKCPQLRYLLKHLLVTLERLSCDAEPLVIIFDDVAQSCEKFIKYVRREVASSTRIKVIATTFNKTLFEKWPGLTVDGFTEDEGCRFMRQESYFSQFDESEILEFVRSVSCRPLGLVTGRKVIQTRQYSIKKYLDIQKDKSVSLKLDSASKEILGTSYNQGLLASVIMTVQHALDELHKEGPIVPNLLLTFALLRPETVPMVLLKAMLRLSVCSNHWCDYYLGLLRELFKKFSLGTISGLDNNCIITMHTVTHRVLSQFFINKEKKAELLQKLLKSLVSCMHKDTREDKNHITVRNLLPHCLNILDNDTFQTTLFEDNFYKCILFDVVGYMYSQSGDVQLSKHYLNKAQLLIRDFLEKYNDDSALQNAEKLYAACMAISSEHFNDDFIREFICNKVQTDKDLDILRSKHNDMCEFTDGNQIPLETYEKLSKKKLCVPLDIVKKTLFLEVVISIFYSYGRVYFYSKQNCSKSKEEYKFYLNLSFCLCELMRKNFTMWPQIHYILSQRNGFLYFLLDTSDKTSELAIKDIITALESYFELAEDNANYYQMGILKLTGGDNYHNAICCNQISKCWQKLAALIPKSKMSYINKTEKHLENLKELMKNIPNHRTIATFHNRVGNFLLETSPLDIHSPLNYFERAIQIEEDIGSPANEATYRLLDAVIGKLKCFRKKNSATYNNAGEQIARCYFEKCKNTSHQYYADEFKQFAETFKNSSVE